MQPLVSILTVVYNGETHLEETVQSVIGQDYPNIEYVIIDGGSTDATLDIIEKYRNRITSLVSEKDNGIYDAINKGLRLCKGEVIKIQNADDLLLPNAVTKAVAELVKYDLSESIILIGESKFIDIDGRQVGRITDKSVVWGFDSFNHPAWFVTAATYQTFGSYSQEFQIASDYEYYLRAKKGGAKIVRLPHALASYRRGGASSGLKGVQEVFLINYRWLGAFYAVLIGSQHMVGKLAQRIKVSLRSFR